MVEHILCSTIFENILDDINNSEQHMENKLNYVHFTNVKRLNTGNEVYDDYGERGVRAARGRRGGGCDKR